MDDVSIKMVKDEMYLLPYEERTGRHHNWSEYDLESSLELIMAHVMLLYFILSGS